MSEDPRRGAPQDPAGSAGQPVDPVEPGGAALHGDPDEALVRDFFTRERDAAPAMAADPERWQAIVEASDRPRHPWLRYAVGAAAAAVVLGAIGLAALGLEAGAAIREDDARAVFERLEHPMTGEALGQRHRRYKTAEVKLAEALEREPDAVLPATAVLVCALVRDRA